MKIQLVSDLHIEGRPQVLDLLPTWRDPEAEVLVLAGDICNLVNQTMYEEVIKATSGWPNRIYIPGNHEYYGTSPQEAHMNVLKAHAKLGPEAIRGWMPALEPCNLFVGKQAFVCGTMWFPAENVRRLPVGNPEEGTWMSTLGPYGMEKMVVWSDFRAIVDITPWIYEQHNKMRELLWDSRPDSIVVTHMLPSHRSVPERFKGSDTNAFFVADREDLMVSQEPKLWLHGHTHQPCDYEFHATRVVANPLGHRYERTLDSYRPVTIEV